ncbi:hypothetical protein BD324DRAFT_512747 [Kockovaella imperatae]|uniref:AMP deaminase n=1 Tax=Kockovaella imperatae TaxID=4999 RepID=A0A1Y1UD48_9TREE|nr:hypothetical protein BD324DRAFT_512747 [Kockovaella imperatae]ORX35953.1 hypothetical protein BD324DRAFT_512747 [Kockovaella imperatae]
MGPERQSSQAIPIPQPSTPVGDDDTPPNGPAHPVDVSPSFDYHDERRLHMNDEIWLSHHLPRLPPASLNDKQGFYPGSIGSSSVTPGSMSPSNHFAQSAGPSLSSSPRLERKAKERAIPSHVSIGQPLQDASPSAFHPTAPELDVPRHAEGGSRMTLEGDDGGDDEGDPGMSTSNAEQTPAADLHPAKAGIDPDNRGDEHERLSYAIERDERELDQGGGFSQNQHDSGQAAQAAQDVTLSTPEHNIGSELKSLYGSFARCLAIRDKYMALSCQRLGDNPRDHDGSFQGFNPPSSGDVSGLKPDANQDQSEVFPPNPSNDDAFNAAPFPAWKIYPPPPAPHWHWTPAEDGIRPEHADDPDAAQRVSSTADDPSAITGERSGGKDSQAFRIETCEIPSGANVKCDFGLNEEGVFEVWYEDLEATGSIPAPASAAKLETEPTSRSAKGKGKQRVSRVPSLKEYFTDLDYLLGVCCDGPAKSFAFRRLKYLASKWSMYCLLNEYQELADMKAVPHRDFYNVRKVDTHIHHSASMNQKHLLRFIKSKLKKAPNEIVIHRDDKDLTLKQVFESLKLTAYDLSIDTLDMHAHQEFHRFDRFNDRYNPTGSSRLREIFLKTDNLLKGKYLAELTQELITDLEQSKYQNSEWRLSIYGRSMAEWDKLAKWVINNKLLSHNVRWLIQVPRLYNVYKQAGQVDSFEDIVKNVFQPLFEVTKDPSTHPELHVFLQRVVGFDSVDDESKPERRLYRKYPTAQMWTTTQSPPYTYWIYYMYANMASLNAWRRARGFNTFVLRPHCGEAGDTDHLSSAFLTAHSISHGILLRKVPALQYLYYLKQIGLAMSPLSNNALFLTYERNPFKDFFRAGLNVSLSTDDPLQFHFTASHLLEEYSCAAQIYKLTPADMCELARNSVIQSGWEMQVKKHWIGQKWYLPGSAGNDIHKTNVPNIRLAYRHATLLEELSLIHHGLHSPSATPTHLKTYPVLPNSPMANTSLGTPIAAPGPGTGLSMSAGDVGAAAMALSTITSLPSSISDAVASRQLPGGPMISHSTKPSLSLPPGGIVGSMGGSVPVPLPVNPNPVQVIEGASALDEKARRKRSVGNFKRDIEEFRTGTRGE